MKIRSLSVLLLFALQAGAQVDSLTGSDPNQPRPQGRAAGERLEYSIGPQGGRIFSADKRVELIFPQGTVRENLPVSIQPLQNNAPLGNGLAYRFEPSGKIFAGEVLLNFHYNDSDLTGSRPELKTLYYQDSTGWWHRLKKITVDTLNRVVSCRIAHFSNYSLADLCRLDPENSTIKVGTTQDLGLAWPGPGPDEFDSLSAIGWGPAIGEMNRRLRPVWYVNDIKWGNDSVGTIVLKPGSGLYATYHAPGHFPPDNPVTIKVELNTRITLDNGRVINKIERYANIKVIEVLHYTFIGYDMAGKLYMIDSSSCDLLTDGKSVIMKNIINHKPWSDWPEHPDLCDYQYTNKDSWLGLVEITGLAGFTYTGPSLTHPFSGFHINLQPATGNTPSANVTCPKGGTQTIPSTPMPAQPRTIDFETDWNEVFVEFGGLKSPNEIRHIVNKQGFIIRISRR